MPEAPGPGSGERGTRPIRPGGIQMMQSHTHRAEGAPTIKAPAFLRRADADD